jgi:hypothetical protein
MSGPTSTELTGEEQKPHLFKPGQSGNPAGRPKGARSKLGEDFLKALHEDFAENGKQVIEKVRAEKPDVYLKVVASILPKEIDLGGELTVVTKEQRDAAVGAFSRAVVEETAH